MRRRYAVMVPDYREERICLSGDLSHNLRIIDEDKIDYIGPLSDFRTNRSDVNCNRDIDVLFSVSGPEPHRTALENRILEQLPKITDRYTTVLTLGKTETRGREDLTGLTGLDHIKVYSSLSATDRTKLLTRAKLVVARSGYSTLMDVAATGTRALFIPTPNQPEQEYLGRYHSEKGTYYSVSQANLDLENDIKKAMGFRGLDRPVNIKQSIANFMDIVHSGKKINW